MKDDFVPDGYEPIQGDVYRSEREIVIVGDPENMGLIYITP